MCMKLAKNLEEAFFNSGSVEEELKKMVAVIREEYDLSVKESLRFDLSTKIENWIKSKSSMDVEFEDIENLAVMINDLFDPLEVRQYG